MTSKTAGGLGPTEYRTTTGMDSTVRTHTFAPATATERAWTTHLRATATAASQNGWKTLGGWRMPPSYLLLSWGWAVLSMMAKLLSFSSGLWLVQEKRLLIYLCSALPLIPTIFSSWAHETIDYRCADGRFLVLPRGVAVSNHLCLFRSETRVNTGMRGWKWHLSESTSRQKSAGYICFTDNGRAASLQPLMFSNQSSNAVISNASPGLTVCFLWVNIGFSERGSQDLSNGTNFAS